MANGHSIVPLDGSRFAIDSLNWLRNERIYASDNLPTGRFPTEDELRDTLGKLGYRVDERGDWDIFSKDDYTQVWFNEGEGRPNSFWFRHGGVIVLDIMQSLANQCGSFIAADHSHMSIIVVVPDSVFGESEEDSADTGFFSKIARRMPVMVERLAQASVNEILFLLTQIRQSLRKQHYLRQTDISLNAHQGLPVYIQLLKHDDTRVRYLTFDLIANLRDSQYANLLREAVSDESDPDIKVLMNESLSNFRT